MRLGLSLGLTDRFGGGAFTPASLFAASEAGAWYDPSDTASMFQDSAGTVAAVVGQPVGRINDKSGRGNHATQAVAASKPVLRQDASLNYYLETDGVDDWLRALFTIAQPWDRISALQQITWTAGDNILSGGSALAGALYQIGLTPSMSLYDGAAANPNAGLAVATNGIVTERHSGATSGLAINNGAYSSGDPGALVPGGVTIGANDTGGSAANVRVYGIVMVGRALTGPEIASTRAFLAGKSGVTL